MSFRLQAALGAAVCAALLGFGYYLQYVEGLNPCPLCLVQRGFFYAVMASFIVAALHPHRVYPWIAALFTLGGITAAGRQVWLQHLPAEKVPACGPDLYFMLENFPLTRTLSTLIKGTGECAVVDWKFLGLSIAGWSLLWFVALLGFALWLALQRRKHLPHQYQRGAAA